MYKIAQQYVEELKGFKGCDGWEEEEQQSSAILSQIQTALQATGERLEESPALLSHPGLKQKDTFSCFLLVVFTPSTNGARSVNAD